MPRTKLKGKNVALDLFEMLTEIAAQKGFKQEDLIEVLKNSLVAAYRKKYKTSDGVDVLISPEKKEIRIIVLKDVVDKVILPGMQIHIDEAKKVDPNINLKDKIKVVEDIDHFGSSAAQTAVYVASQKIRLLEQEKTKEEYSNRIGELINGYIIYKRGDTVYLDLGKVEAIMPVKHQIPRERYRTEDKVKVLLHMIEEDKNNTLKVIVSRTERRFVQKLFEMEVPEIYEGAVEIVTIGRVPGIRSKIVVRSNTPGVDPVGACVGIRGVRIQTIVRELGNERVDIMEYSSNSKEYIKKAISPANPTMVKVDPINNQALVLVSDQDLSAAIGKEGSNVKIASYITGYKINIKSESEFSQEIVSPKARENFEKLFSSDQEPDENETLLSELPKLSKRIIHILHQNNIKTVENLLSLDEEGLIALEGIGKTTAKKIIGVISENIEFEEETEESHSPEEEEENTKEKD